MISIGNGAWAQGAAELAIARAFPAPSNARKATHRSRGQQRALDLREL